MTEVVVWWANTKAFKMAGKNDGPNDKDSYDFVAKLTTIADAVSNLQKGKKELRSSFDKKN